MIGKLSLKNLAGKPGRTAAMVLLAMFLSFSIFAGSLTVLSLQQGLNGLEARLGADIIVVPYEATTKFDVKSMLLQGNPGYFYLNRSFADKVATRPGVEATSCQLYLASVSAGCCSVAVQLIGFDPESDFTILPWAQETYHGEIGFGDVLVGSDISVPTDGVLRFFDVDCRVVAQLAKTGSALDTAVYANMETIQALIEASQAKGLNQYNDISADEVVSSVLVRVAEGYDVESVKNDINLHVRKVVAVRASNMISTIADNLTGVSRLIGAFIAAIWVLSLVIMMIALTMLMNERRREFAILRVMGASRRKLAGLVMAESALTNLLGGAAGVALAALVVFPFSGVIEARLGLPFVLPGGGRVLALALGSLAACLAAGAAISAVCAARISRIDTSLILREGN